MKIRLRLLAFSVFVLFLSAGCSGDSNESADAALSLGPDPAATIIEIFGIQDRFERTEKLIAALRAVPADRVSVFREVLDRWEGRNRELDRVLVITAWSKFDAPAATRWAMNKERVEIVQSAMFAESVYQWALADPESFVADMDVAAHRIAGTDSGMLRGLVSGWYDSGKPRLEDYILNLERMSIDSQRAVSQLIELKTAREGVGGLIAWANGLPGDRYMKAMVFGRVAAAIVVVDPKMAKDWCAEICGTPVGKEIPHLMAATWAQIAPEDAMNWITAMPDEVGNRTGARATYRRFIIDNPGGAIAWMEARSDEERRQPVMQGPLEMFISKVSTEDMPELAIEWLEKYIVDDKVLSAAYAQICRRWLRMDGPAAEAWMAQSTRMPQESKDLARENAAPRKARVR